MFLPSQPPVIVMTSSIPSHTYLLWALTFLPLLQISSSCVLFSHQKSKHGRGSPSQAPLCIFQHPRVSTTTPPGFVYSAFPTWKIPSSESFLSSSVTPFLPSLSLLTASPTSHFKPHILRQDPSRSLKLTNTFWQKRIETWWWPAKANVYNAHSFVLFLLNERQVFIHLKTVI